MYRRVGTPWRRKLFEMHTFETWEVWYSMKLLNLPENKNKNWNSLYLIQLQFYTAMQYPVHIYPLVISRAHYHFSLCFMPLLLKYIQLPLLCYLQAYLNVWRCCWWWATTIIAIHETILFCHTLCTMKVFTSISSRNLVIFSWNVSFLLLSFFTF